MIRTCINAVKRALPERGAHGLDLAEFFVIQRVIGFKVPTAPVFDAEGTAYFLGAIERAKFYLEYGGGGSTVVASRLRKRFLSVDSDPYFARALSKQVAPEHASDIIYVDIGTTGLWGAPLRRANTEARREQWRQYPRAPWARIAASSDKPDLILLDGRFRVACALTCLKNLDGDSNATILVDDYLERPHYRVIERFAHLEAMHGRMARFSARVNDPRELDQQLAESELDWQ